MKRNSLKALLFACIAGLGLFLSSCQGDPGPAGPQGEPGNANVFTAVYEEAPNAWSGDVNGYSLTLSVPEITADIYENGAVLVYTLQEKNPDNKSFNMLPYTYLDTTSYEYMDYDAYVGKITIKLKWTDKGVNTTAAPIDKYIFKIVIIKGTPLATLKKLAPVNDYGAMLKFLKKSGYSFY